MLNNKINANGAISKRLLNLGVFSFSEAIQYVRQLPYGRTKDRANADLVIEEGKGSCSTKHALIKKLALEQDWHHVKLYMCMYKMSASNTAKIEAVLKANDLEYIPEAHCVLKIEDDFLDITSSSSDYKKIEDAVLQLEEILPEQIGDYKVAQHKAYMRSWMVAHQLAVSFDDLWRIREQCIKALGQ